VSVIITANSQIYAIDALLQIFKYKIKFVDIQQNSVDVYSFCATRILGIYMVNVYPFCACFLPFYNGINSY